MVIPHIPLPVTLGDLGDDWRLEYHCLGCGYTSGTAMYYLKRDRGADFKLADLLAKLHCTRCQPAGRPHDCALEIFPTYWYTPHRPAGSHRWQMRRGGGWQVVA
jgi:hypothetical protein